jgi:integrase/recombinase XerD
VERGPATARGRQLAVRRFSDWLADEGEIPVDPLVGITSPQLDTAVVGPLTEHEIKLLLRRAPAST